MKKRAIILVPGFSKRERFAVRKQLVEALTHYTDGYRTQVSEAAADSDTDNETDKLLERQRNQNNQNNANVLNENEDSVQSSQKPKKKKEGIVFF